MDYTAKLRQTKILATVGPASSSVEMIRKLVEAGANCFRLNFSHGSYEEHQNRYDAIRQVEKETGTPIMILADMQGPKHRLGQFENEEIFVEPGHVITFDSNPEKGNEKRVCLPHPEIIEALNVGDNLLIDDGKVRVKVIAKGEGSVTVEVIAGKRMSDRKGVNVPDVVIKSSVLTEKDRKDLEYALNMGVDWIALSFVQTAGDVREAKELINGRAPVISKIEKPSAVEDIDAIIAETDAIMVARGDLGVEMPAERVPVIQKMMIRKTRNAGKPIVVATQMLESMITSPTPTRAEASDVATAVFDGADAVMLSAETAAGDFPVEAVSIMARICQTVENDPLYRQIMDANHPAPEKNAYGALTAAASTVAQTIDAKAIVNYTRTGLTTLRVVRERPTAPVLCLTEDVHVARRLMISYGVRALPLDDIFSLENVDERAVALSKAKGLAKSGDCLVMTAGIPLGEPGSTNLVRVINVG